MEFSGRLSSFPLPQLLQWAHHELRTGSLQVRRNRREKRIAFQDGAIVACFSDDPAEYLGRYLVIHGLLEEEALARALIRMRRQEERLGEAILDLGLLPEDTLRRALREQIEDAICDLFLWKTGIFLFERQALEPERLLPEPIDTMALVMEGSRWLDDYARIQQILPDDQVVLEGTGETPEVELGAYDVRILAGLDGRRTLAEVWKGAHGSFFRFLEACHLLVESGLARVRDHHDRAPSADVRIRNFDALVEDATEEQILFLRRQLAVSPELLARLFPVWVSEPALDEAEDDHSRERSFYDRFDGSRSIGDLLDGEEEDRSWREERFLQQLRSGRVALLPRPLRELEDEARGTPLGWLRRVVRLARSGVGR